MKTQVEMILVLFLVVLMYYKPQCLLDLTESFLGKIILLSVVLVIASEFGRNSGILIALIIILLMHTKQEGLRDSSPVVPAEDPTKAAKPQLCPPIYLGERENFERQMRSKPSGDAVPAGKSKSDEPFSLHSSLEGFSLFN